MPKKVIGNVCAYIPPSNGRKAQYPRIGMMFQDTEGDNRFSLKIDSLPVDPAWEGWCNVFPPYQNKTDPADEFAPKPKAKGNDSSDDLQDDIPF